jgi:hypothetical protein
MLSSSSWTSAGRPGGWRSHISSTPARFLLQLSNSSQMVAVLRSFSCASSKSFRTVTYVYVRVQA